jgi:hypothetical protein
LEDFACRTHGTDEPIGRFQQIGAFPAEDIVIFEAERFRLGKFAGQVCFRLLIGCKPAAWITSHISISLRNRRQLQAVSPRSAAI